jgi:O-acetylhomoserine/O-acetylserine sulfhydrylase
MNLWEVFGPAGPFGANIALAVRARIIGLRDMGPCQNPFGSFMLVQGLETLSLRGRAHSANANALAEWLSSNPNVSWVSHPSLSAHPCHKLAVEYFRKDCFGAVLSFGIKGGAVSASAFISALKLVSHVANVGDAKTLAIHPWATTHEQLSEKERGEAGVTDDLIRISVGYEDIDDIKADFELGFAAAAAAK